jgi:hypothetical protein
MYDGEFPEASIGATLDFLEIDRNKLENTIDTHRRSDLWEKSAAGWRLRYPLLATDI